jgi:hypothetical protein
MKRYLSAFALALTLTLALLGSGLASDARDGIVLTFSEQTDNGFGPKETITITQGRILFENANDRENILIFQEQPATLIHVDHGRRSYLKLDRERLEELRSDLTALLGQALLRLDKQTEGLPPEKREALKAKLGAKLDQLSAPKQSRTKKSPVEYQDTGETVKVGKFECTVFEGRENDDHKACELFMAERDSTKVTGESLQTLLYFSEFIEDIASSLPGTARLRGASTVVIPRIAPEKFPVKITRFRRDGSTQTTILRSVASINVDPARLQIPIGYAPITSGPTL